MQPFQCGRYNILQNFKILFAHKKLKKPRSKVAQKYSIFFSPIAAQTAQTEEFMFQNVAYRQLYIELGKIPKMMRFQGKRKERINCVTKKKLLSDWTLLKIPIKLDSVVHLNQYILDQKYFVSAVSVLKNLLLEKTIRLSINGMTMSFVLEFKSSVQTILIIKYSHQIY